MPNRELTPEQLQLMLDTAREHGRVLGALLHEAMGDRLSDDVPEIWGYTLGVRAFQRVAQATEMPRPEAAKSLAALVEAGILEARGQVDKDDFGQILGPKKLQKRLHNHRPVRIDLRPRDTQQLLHMTNHEVLNEIRD